MSEDKEGEREGTECNLFTSSSGDPTEEALDEEISRAKREAAAARIRAIREAGQQRIEERFRAHLDDHGEEYETSVEEFMREKAGDKPPEG